MKTKTQVNSGTEHPSVERVESPVSQEQGLQPMFTPAPWRWTAGLSSWDGQRPLESLPTFDALEGADGQLVLTGVWRTDGTGEIGIEGNSPEANARLIAAAPALYAALRQVLNVMSIQENRDSGVFHLHVDAFRPMWDSAGLAGYNALALAGGDDAERETESVQAET